MIALGIALFMALTARTWLRVDRLCDEMAEETRPRVRKMIRADVGAATGWWLVGAALLMLALRGRMMGLVLLSAGVLLIGIAVARQPQAERRPTA